MKNSLLSLVNSEGVSFYQLTDRLHTSRKAIIQTVYQLQEDGYHIYIGQEKVYYIKDKSMWPYIAFFVLGQTFIYSMIWAVIQ